MTLENWSPTTQEILNRAIQTTLGRGPEVYVLALSNRSRSAELDPASQLRARLGSVAQAHPIYPRPSAWALAQAQEELSRGKPMSEYVSEGRR